MFLIMKVLMDIKFMVIMEAWENTEKHRRETRKGFDTDVDLIQQPVVSNVLWIHQKIICQFKNVYYRHWPKVVDNLEE